MIDTPNLCVVISEEQAAALELAETVEEFEQILGIEPLHEKDLEE